VWSFTNIGLRRTRSLVGGLLPTAPFHWEGDLPDLDALVLDIFTKRRGGLVEDSAHVAALARFSACGAACGLCPRGASPRVGREMHSARPHRGPSQQ
jgi:hypothetical protein